MKYAAEAAYRQLLSQQTTASCGLTGSEHVRMFAMQWWQRRPRWLGGFRQVKQLEMTGFAPLPQHGYLVGGALRDVLRGRPWQDLDWLVPEPQLEAMAAVQQLQAQGFEAHVFALDEARDHWRVVTAGTVRDYVPLRESLAENLQARDYCLNAMALELPPTRSSASHKTANIIGTLHDPLRGQEDLWRGQLRMVSPESLAADLLRPLRGVRLASDLALQLEPNTCTCIRDLSQQQQQGDLALPAWERAAEECNRILLSPRASQGFLLMEALGLLELYLPELARCRAVSQGGFHHLDVLGHLIEALRQLLLGFPEAPLSLRWATLLHDIGKPDCKSHDADGRYYHFYGHDKHGAQLAATLLRRLRQPQSQLQHSCELIRYHMLPLPQDRKASKRFVHRRQTLLPDLLKLMLADREAARGRLSSAANRRNYRLAVAQVLEVLEAMQHPQQASPPLLDGREVMALLELPPGPEIGAALRFIHEAQAVGDIHDKSQAAQALQHYAEQQGWLEPTTPEQGSK